MTQLDTQREQSLQRTLRIVSIVTMVLGFLIRVLTPGWMLLVFCIPILIALLIHVIIQYWAIKKIPQMKPAYMYLILLSNLFLFLGLTLPIDGGDDPHVYVPLLFQHAFPVEAKLPNVLNAISTASFLGLVISWAALLVLGNSWRKKEERVP